MNMNEKRMEEQIYAAMADRIYGLILLVNENTGKIFRVREQGKLEAVPEDGGGKDHTSVGELIAYARMSPMEKIKEELKDNGIYNTLLTDAEKTVWRITWQYLERGKPWLCMAARDFTDLFTRDLLTGMLNQTFFLDRAGKVIKESKPGVYAILFFNVVNFNAFNLTFGYKMGDRILKRLSGRLQKSFLEPVLCSRVESDHFAALVKRDKLDMGALTELLKYEFHIQNSTYCFYGNCGIYLVDNPSAEINFMCDCARLASHCIENTYTKPYAFYDEAMRNRQLNHSLFQINFESSIKDGNFKIYYQPVLDIRTGEVASAEALVRWELPGHGLISPAEFIPVLEHIGYISKLDIYVSQRVFNFQERRMAEGRQNVPVSINISRMDIYDMTCMDQIYDYIKSEPKVMQLMRFEITESSYLDIPQVGKLFLEVLRQAGVKVLIDDFGKGKSSFSTIEEIGFDFLKMDIGFVKKIGKSDRNDLVCKAIIDMSHAIGVKVIAEGVETEEQIDFLRRNNCDYIQGFYYARPMPEHDFDRFLDSLL